MYNLMIKEKLIYFIYNYIDFNFEIRKLLLSYYIINSWNNKILKSLSYIYNSSFFFQNCFSIIYYYYKSLEYLHNYKLIHRQIKLLLNIFISKEK